MANGRNGGRKAAYKPRVETRYPIAQQGVSFESNMVQQMLNLQVEIQEQALRSAAHQGSLVFYNEAKQRAPVGPTGRLRDSIYRKHVSSKSNADRQVYHVGPNKSKAPHWHLVEYGYMQPYVVVKLQNGEWRTTKRRRDQPKFIPPKPYMRPTYLSKRDQVLARMRETMQKRVAEITRGLAQ